ncbi:hypothetical protein PRECH8_04010 [Insulibacter thermoxylanivorax]|uniref:DUF3298 domain-containing protein n=1 Tax=Insulibacter thermoxylanivorax TaxID=2749268 RepID=A0A916QAE4_9BACL|nr:DUF3298 and DUF4163 domain-containing protein [Insulibacter thermoxylanivorax]GFR37105.1 hypothetical protein PRECH8_04010 [Insulibacter thermoxylanivorax]
MELNALPVLVYTYPIQQPKLQAKVPIIRNVPSAAAEHAINQTIQNLYTAMIAETGYPQNPAVEVTSTYQIKTNERGVLSLSLIVYYFSGGAHGLTLQRSLTFDVQTGKSYNLSELFKPGAPYVERLSTIVREQIAARELPVFEPFNSIRPDQDYYIADKALVLYFQLYELVPYVYGFPYFPISVYQIQDLIDDNGPLGIMIP